MPTIEHNGSTFDVDEDGFLVDGLEAWNEDWVDCVMVAEGIPELTEEHQKIVESLQDYFRKNGTAPMVRMLSKATGFPLKRIYELFPTGPGRGACRMAGLPRPVGCI